MVALGGRLFLMSEVPHVGPDVHAKHSLHRRVLQYSHLILEEVGVPG